MIEIVDPSDARAVRNKDAILVFYESIEQKRPDEAAATMVRRGDGYVQHNPLIANGGDSLGQFFATIAAERANARVVVHRIIAAGDWVWAHVNFLNLFNDDPTIRGSPGSTYGEWTPTAKPSSTGTRCNSSGRPRIRLRGRGRTSLERTKTRCSRATSLLVCTRRPGRRSPGASVSPPSRQQPVASAACRSRDPRDRARPESQYPRTCAGSATMRDL